MAAVTPRINKKEDSTQSRLNGIKTTTHASPSLYRFRDASKSVMAGAASTRRSSTGMHRDAPLSLHPSESSSFHSGKFRRNSLSDVVARAPIVMNRTTSGYTMPNNSGNTGRRDNQNCLANAHVGSTKLSSDLQGKLVSGDLASTSGRVNSSRYANSRAERRVADAKTRDSATQHRTSELCKDCSSRVSRMESICFITNDGKISAAPTGALHARHSHHCNVRGCARNSSNRQPPSAPLSRRGSLSGKQASLYPQPTRRKSLDSMSGTGPMDHEISTTSSVRADDDKREQEADSSVKGSTEISTTAGADTLDTKKEVDRKEVLIKCSEDHDAENCVNTNSPHHASTDQNGQPDVVSHCQETSAICLPTPVGPVDQESYGDNTHVENIDAWSGSPAASSFFSDMHGDDDHDHDHEDKDSAYRAEIQALNDFQNLINYHGDNEYSCSEGGTDVTTTPISSSKGAFDDLSNNIDNIEQSHSECGMSRPRRRAFARMTQRYLDSLSEQEAEKVRLRKQEAMARRQAGDWMLDCHMEEVLHRLAPTGEAHVKVLVEAFETVMNQSDSDCSQTAHHLHHEHPKALPSTKASS